MQTTLRIDEEIYRRSKAKAASEGITLTKFIEEALCLRLGRVSENGDEAPQSDFIGRLQSLFDRADKRDNLKEGSAGPFSREELYAERIDRLR